MLHPYWRFTSRTVVEVPANVYAATIMRLSIANVDAGELAAAVAADGGTLAAVQNCASIMRNRSTNVSTTLGGDDLNLSVEML